MKMAYKINGRRVTRQEFQSYRMARPARSAPGPAVAFFSDSTPRRSESFAFNTPDQMRLANEILKQNGITGAYCDPNPEPGRRKGGQLVFTSERQRAKAVRVLSPLLGLRGTIHDDHEVLAEVE